MSVWRKLYDFFLPPRCLLCGSLMLPQQDGTLCNACLQGIENHTGPVCVRCGIGFVSPAGRDRLCSSCRDAEPVFDTARSLGAYTGLLRQAIQDFKYRRKPFLGAPLGKLLSAYGMRVLPEREHRVLMPVPLHRHRLRERGYNQSLLLARHLAQHRDMAVMPEGLCRHRRTIPQTSLSGRERRRNLRNAFSLGGVACEGLHVLLIDDVFTSGATVNECARVLKRHGAACVDVLTLARRQ